MILNGDITSNALSDFHTEGRKKVCGWDWKSLIRSVCQGYANRPCDKWRQHRAQVVCWLVSCACIFLQGLVPLFFRGILNASGFGHDILYSFPRRFLVWWNGCNQPKTDSYHRESTPFAFGHLSPRRSPYLCVSPIWSPNESNRWMCLFLLGCRLDNVRKKFGI